MNLCKVSKCLQVPHTILKYHIHTSNNLLIKNTHLNIKNIDQNDTEYEKKMINSNIFSNTNTLLYSTRQVNSLGYILLFSGFATLAFGTKYYIQGARAYREEMRKRKQQEDGQNNTTSDIYDNKRFYEGGFDQTMSPREAAQILGCRESACKEQIMERYRILIKLNHPDIGGSPLIASKINDAKMLLYSGARSDPTYTRRKMERENRRKRRTENVSA